MNYKNSERVRFGPYEADLHTHELWKFGIKVKLVGQPFEVLAILLSRPGGLVTREELRDRLWPGDTFVDFNHGLNAAVNRLREALCDSADEPKYVETLPRRGYRFIAAIKPSTEKGLAAAPGLDVRAEGIPAARGSPGLVAASPAVEVPVAPRFVPERAAALPRYGMPLSWRIASASGALVVVVGILLMGLMVRKKILAGTEAEASGAGAWKRIQPLTTLTDGTNYPAISGDGNFVAFRREGAKPENSGIFVKALASDQLLQLTSNARDGFPVWSPDGQSVAFSRWNGENDRELYDVPLARGQARVLSKNDQKMTVIGGEEERKIDTGDVKPTRGELDWSPDGRTIAFVSRGSIYLLSLADHSTRRLTDPPPPLSEDWGPSFSPDGKRILFVRETRDAATAEITVIPVSGGDPRQVLADPAGIVGTPRWSVDGQSVGFGSSRGSHAGLWRTAVDTREQAVEIHDAGWFPSISRRGYRMAYQRAMRGLNIWELDLGSKGSEQRILLPSTSQTDQGPGPQFFSGWQKAGIHVGPVGDDGDLGERPGWE